MFLNKRDEDMFSGSFDVMRHLYETICNTPVSEAVKDLSELGEAAKRFARKDTKDTMMIDASAEGIIAIGNERTGHISRMLDIYGISGVVITEECGRLPRDTRIDHSTPVIISDPIDASSYFSTIVKSRKDGERLADVFDRERMAVGEAAARRHACNSSVTLIKDNMLKYTIVVNLLTGDVYVGSRKGVFRGNMESAKNLGDVNNPVDFVSNESIRMLCYTKEGKYERNREGTFLRLFQPHEFSFSGPVGPMRFTYLVRFDDKRDGDVGAIAHNGEKIQESLPNVAMAAFSGGRLKAYKLFCDEEQANFRGEQELTPNISNSLYDGRIEQLGIKSSFLNSYDYPSEFRDTTLVYPAVNLAADCMTIGIENKRHALRIV